MKIMTWFNMLYSFILSIFVQKEEVKPTSNFPLRMDLQFFAAADSSKDGDDGADDDSDDDSKDKPFAVFKNKEELDKRINRAEKAGQKALAKQLGFETVEEMQNALKKSGTDVDKSVDKDKSKSDGSDDVDAIIEQKLKEEREKTFTRLLTSEVKVVAKELGFADYEDALKLADLSEVKENEKGEIEGVEEALKALSEKKPHLLEKSNKGGFGSDISNKKKQSEKDRLESIKKMAQNRGVQVQTPVNDPWKR